MEKTPLQQMIDLWEGIQRLHFDAMTSETEAGHGIFARDFREQSRLRSKAVMVVAALRHYQIELER